MVTHYRVSRYGCISNLKCQVSAETSTDFQSHRPNLLYNLLNLYSTAILGSMLVDKSQSYAAFDSKLSPGTNLLMGELQFDLEMIILIVADDT